MVDEAGGFVDQSFEETGAEQADCEEAAEDGERFVAFAALALPVDITQVQPQCEFI